LGAALFSHFDGEAGHIAAPADTERSGPLQLGGSHPLNDGPGKVSKGPRVTILMGRVFEAVLRALRENCPHFKKFPAGECLRCGLFRVCDTVKNLEKIRKGRNEAPRVRRAEGH